MGVSVLEEGGKVQSPRHISINICRTGNPKTEHTNH
jgi:hypothetical protein